MNMQSKHLIAYTQVYVQVAICTSKFIVGVGSASHN